ncbi:E3 ubiquitin-protein ligase UHRF1-like [Diabrotica undecimpunctata]|uniref:E3 ubiquitin-protein ligase UHRF1-like n=1 Tax=Diabrotica undecimpunctata TaxID=50387 RepID=UPI003B6416AF
MYIKIRKNGDEKQEWVISVSKQDKVSVIEKLVTQKTGVKPKQQTLLFKGKTLESKVCILDYQIQNNNVVQLFVRDIDNSESKESTDAKNTEDSDKNLIEAESKYYAVGDLIDVLLEDDGTWYEAFIVKIYFKKEPFEILSEEDENKLIFRIKSANHIIPGFETDAGFNDIRPRSYHIYKPEELCPGMIVLANYNLEEKHLRGHWYNFKIEEASKLNVIGTALVGKEQTAVENCKLIFVDRIMRIEHPVQLTEVSAEERLSRYSEKTNRIYPYNCNTCKDDKNKKCRECGCTVCHTKQNWEDIILCDECDDEYHLECLDPPLDEVPEGDWYCPECKTDDSEIVKRGEGVRLSKKRANMPSKTTTSTRDWGRGMACAGRTTECTVVSKDHFGPIPGIDVGRRWKYRAQVSEVGVHRLIVGGIHGSANIGAYSIVLSGGYEDDIDQGDEFIYTGSGGRDLSGNKRVNKQSMDQEFKRGNMALAVNCNAPLDKNGAEATDWRAGLPVRVVRKGNPKINSKYSPKDGLRYDGIYKVVKYYPEKGESGFLVYRYLLRRDDPNPAPWEEGGHEDDIVYPDNYSEKQAEKEKKGKPSKGRKRKASEDEMEELEEKENKSTKERNTITSFFNGMSNSSKKIKIEYEVPEEISKLIKEDVDNAALWDDCNETIKLGKQKYLAKIQENFKCACCQDMVYNPITTECKHNMCEACMRRAFKSNYYNCPYCRFELGGCYDLTVNETLSQILNMFFPGYGK